jgi:RHS repeat-associated protein
LAIPTDLAAKSRRRLLSEGENVSPRWVGSGWTIFNNKGKPVRQYEPFFTATHKFEFAREEGISPVLFYDTAGRVVATLHPDHSWEKVVFDSWSQESWDASDTVLIADPKTDPDVGDFFARLPDSEYLPSWHDARVTGARGTEAKAAAEKTAIHAATPLVAHSDVMGRGFLAIAHNAWKTSLMAVGDPRLEEFHETRTVFDAEGNQRAVIDAHGRTVMRFDFDMLGRQIAQHGMDGGSRWTLSDVAGNPIRGWDMRGHMIRSSYDALHRPLATYVTAQGGAEAMVMQTDFGEGQPWPEAKNLRGKAYQLFDQAGVVTTPAYDFKGNVLESSRQLTQVYKERIDWAAPVPLEPELFSTQTSYDALNRPIAITTPDGSTIHPGFNEANLLERVDINLKGASPATPFVSNIDYDAKGQRALIAYGNGVTTRYAYDAESYRLTHMKTERSGFVASESTVQDLHFTYDIAGNITHIRDDAQQSVFFKNQLVEPSCSYIYDAVHHLIEATGREHLGQIGGQAGPPAPSDVFDSFRRNLPQPGDGNAMGTYVERYAYDAVGNILEMQHRGSSPAHSGWTRSFAYDAPSLIEPGKTNNRLTETSTGSGPGESYAYDVHGNMLAMPHLPLMVWNDRDQLQATVRTSMSGGSTPETTYYVYDAGGERVRKVTERQTGPGQVPTRKQERIYLAGFEIYREYAGDGTSVDLERETLHVMDDQRRIALVESRTAGNDGSPPQLIRYQMGNYLGSASLELDDAAAVISYEEYTPYGSTSYHATRSQQEAAKRYRYTGKERDEETGLSYHSARYYAPWLTRWMSADPIGIGDGVNLYGYCRASPSVSKDPTGYKTKTDDPKKPKHDKQKMADITLNEVVISTKSNATVSSENGIKSGNDKKKTGWLNILIGVGATALAILAAPILGPILLVAAITGGIMVAGGGMADVGIGYMQVSKNENLLKSGNRDSKLAKSINEKIDKDENILHGLNSIPKIIGTLAAIPFSNEKSMEKKLEGSLVVGQQTDAFFETFSNVRSFVKGTKELGTKNPANPDFNFIEEGRDAAATLEQQGSNILQSVENKIPDKSLIYTAPDQDEFLEKDEIPVIGITLDIYHLIIK